MAEDTLKHDPTRTIGIRKRWNSQFNRRYKMLKSRINKLLISGESSGIPVPVVNKEFEFTSDARSVAEFMAWLQLQINQLFFTNGQTASTSWQNVYIDQSYERGIARSLADIRRLGVTPEMLRTVSSAKIIGTATASLGVGISTSLHPIHLESIQLLYTRDFAALKGITDEMSKQIARVLVEGVEQGLSIRNLSKTINDRVDKVGLTRSKLLARTETSRVYNIGATNEFDVVATNVGLPTQMEWVTAGDEDVRPEHAKRNGKIYDKDTALKLIGEPNCRCGLKPYIDPKLLDRTQP